LLKLVPVFGRLRFWFVYEVCVETSGFRTVCSAI
jgi:hypothetical protein